MLKELPKFFVKGYDLYIQDTKDSTYSLVSDEKTLFGMIHLSDLNNTDIFRVSKEDKDDVKFFKDNGEGYYKYKRVYVPHSFFLVPMIDEKTGGYIFKYVGELINIGECDNNGKVYKR